LWYILFNEYALSNVAKVSVIVFEIPSHVRIHHRMLEPDKRTALTESFDDLARDKQPNRH
jgi:hypothetical protein